MVHASPYPGGVGRRTPANLFDGPAEADETYFGGKVKNWPLSKRKAKGRKGRGTFALTPVAGVIDRPTQAHPDEGPPGYGHADRRGLCPGWRQAGSGPLYRRVATAYTRLLRADYDHEAVKHSAFEYVRGPVHTNSLESFWSTLKRAYHGTYHHLSKKHLQRYMNEFAGRHAIRDAGTLAQMEATTRGLVGRRITYRELTS